MEKEKEKEKGKKQGKKEKKQEWCEVRFVFDFQYLLTRKLWPRGTLTKMRLLH